MIGDIEKDRLISLKKLGEDSDYFNNVFKKTERVASVIFYVLSYLPQSEQSSVHKNNVSNKTFTLHETALKTLEVHRYESERTLSELLHALTALESTLRLASAAQLLSNDALFVITTEIDSIVRSINNNYLQAPSLPPATEPRRPQPPRREVQSPRPSTHRVDSEAERPAASGPLPAFDMSSDAARVKAAMPDRAMRIKTVLEAAGEASIKDISDVIRDCSEKTIQRELNALIERGEVIRTGERRWSRYAVLK